MCHCCFGVLIFFFFSEILCHYDTKNIILVLLNFHKNRFANDILFTKISLKQVITVFKISVSCLGNLEPKALAL